MLLKTLANASSCNSATRLSHFLCFDRCFFLHAALQYFTNLHLLQVFTLPPSLPQLAHFDKVDASLLLPCVIILLFWGIIVVGTHCNAWSFGNNWSFGFLSVFC